MLTARVACPYCYETYPARQIMFRCNGRTSRDGKQCEMRQDEVLARSRGIRRDLGPVFKPDGWAKGKTNAATCPDCGNSTNYRICPVCHSLLPAQFGMISSRMIAMARRQGRRQDRLHDRIAARAAQSRGSTV